MGDSVPVKIIKYIFLITNVLAIASGVVVIILSILSILRTPALACIAVRMVICGVTLLVDGVFGTFFTSMCDCCKCFNDKCLKSTFAASFSICLELALYGGMYSFYVDNWQSLVFLDANSGSKKPLNYAQTENIDDLLKSYLLPLKLSAILCFIMLVVMFINSILSMILLGPSKFLKVCQD